MDFNNSNKIQIISLYFECKNQLLLFDINLIIIKIILNI